MAAPGAPNPPLALSHLPLRRIQTRAVSVHDHLARAPRSTGRHINVSVERTNYAPVRLTSTLELARRPDP